MNLGDWVAREKNDAGLAARVTLNRGIALAQRGDFAPALAFILASLRDCQARRDAEGIPRALLEIGVIYRKQGNLPLALDYFQRTLAALQGLDETRNIVTLKLGYDALGEIHAALGNYGESRRFYETRFQLETSYQDTFLTWGEKMLLARLDALAGRHHEALLGFIAARDEIIPRRNLNINTSGLNLNIPEDLARVNLHLAALYRRERAFDKALAAAQDAVAPALQTKNQDLIGQVYTLLGQIQEDLQQPDAAAQSYRQAVAAIEEQRGRIVGREETYADYFAGRITPYTGLVRLLLQPKTPAPQRLAEAFAFAERGKARGAD